MATSPYLSPDIRHRQFAMEFFKDFDATAASERCGYHSSNPRAKAQLVHKLMVHPRVQRYMAAEFAKLQQRIALEQEQHARAVMELAYSDLRDLCAWGPDGVILKDSATIPPEAARAVQSVKSTKTTRVIPRENAPPIEETKTLVDIQLHSKVAAQSLLHTMFDKGQATRQALEVKLRALAALAGRYIPAGDHARYLADVRMVLDDVPSSVSGPPAHE
jgi:hypothetical protein